MTEAKRRHVMVDLHDARKQMSTARRSSADAEFEDARRAYAEDAQAAHDEAVLQLWFAQRPS